MFKRLGQLKSKAIDNSSISMVNVFTRIGRNIPTAFPNKGKQPILLGLNYDLFHNSGTLLPLFISKHEPLPRKSNRTTQCSFDNRNSLKITILEGERMMNRTRKPSANVVLDQWVKNRPSKPPLPRPLMPRVLTKTQKKKVTKKKI